MQITSFEFAADVVFVYQLLNGFNRLQTQLPQGFSVLQAK